MIHEDAKYTDTGLYKNIGELIRDCARDMSIDELEAWADDVDIALMAARKERGRKSVECHTLASELDNIMEVLKEKRDDTDTEADDIEVEIFDLWGAGSVKPFEFAGKKSDIGTIKEFLKNNKGKSCCVIEVISVRTF